MARSKRKTPVRAITSSESEKSNKAASHRKIRRTVRQIVPADPDAVLPLEKELTNTFSMAKDGKTRFDPEKTRSWLVSKVPTWLAGNSFR